MSRIDDLKAELRTLRMDMTKAGGYLDDAQASTVPALFPAWARGNWRDYTLNVIVSHADKLWKFRQSALADESQNREPGSVGSESLWIEIKYKNGVKVIPFPRRALAGDEKFMKDELGWWEGDAQAKRGIWKSPADNTVWPPATVGVNWTFVRDE